MPLEGVPLSWWSHESGFDAAVDRQMKSANAGNMSGIEGTPLPARLDSRTDVSSRLESILYDRLKACDVKFAFPETYVTYIAWNASITSSSTLISRRLPAGTLTSPS